MSAFVHPRIILLLFATLIFSGCVSPLPGVWSDPSFTPDAIHSGRLGLIVVNGADKNSDQRSRNENSELMLFKLRKYRPSYEAISSYSVAEQLTEESYRVMVEQYRLNAFLDSKTLARIGKELTSVRYLLLARINRNETSSKIELRRDSFQNKKGFVETGPPYYVAIASRDVSVTTNVYDLRNGKRVWGALIDYDFGEQRTFSLKSVFKKRSKSDKILDVVAKKRDVVDSLLTDEERLVAEKDMLPPTPKLTDVLGIVFRKIAENFPMNCEELGYLERMHIAACN